jgi:hypothetical protein
MPRRRNDPFMFWAATMMIFVLVLICYFFCKEACGSPLPELIAWPEQGPEQGQTRTAEGVIKLLDRDHAPLNDPRRAIAEDIAKAIDAAAQATGGDPWLLTSMIFHESSFQLSACGKKNEKGLLQVHGVALNRCRKKGINPTADLDQSALCGALWLAEANKWCGFEVRNWKKCKKTRITPDCDGGLSAYLSGKCVASTMASPRVAARLRTRDKLVLDTVMPIQ